MEGEISFISEPTDEGLSGSILGEGVSFDGPAMALRFVVILMDDSLVAIVST